MLGGHDQLGTEPCLLRKDAQGTLKDKGSGSSTKFSLRTCPLAFSGGTPSTPQPETGLLNGTSAKFKAVPSLAWQAAGRTDCLRGSRLPPYLEGSEGQSTPGLRPQGAATAWGGPRESGGGSGVPAAASRPHSSWHRPPACLTHAHNLRLRWAGCPRAWARLGLSAAS